MKLVNVSKRCRCGKNHYMANTDDRHICRCNRIVAFNVAQKQHYIKHEEELAHAREAEM